MRSGDNADQQSSVKEWTEQAITDADYEPQQKIQIMTMTQKKAFLSYYNLLGINNRRVGNDPYPTINELDNVEGVRIVHWSIGKEKDATLSSDKPPLKDSPAALYTKSLLHTDQGISINATSTVHGLRFQTPLDTDFATKELKTAPSDVLRVMFSNAIQIPAEPNRPPVVKPCVHLLIFGESFNGPLLVVERYIKDKGRGVKVFNFKLEQMGKIECTTQRLKRKITITGPDMETPLWTIKSTGLFGGDDLVILTSPAKKKVGLITPRFVTDPPTAESSGHDVFFPVGIARWSDRAMMMIVGLYMDYLWTD